MSSRIDPSAISRTFKEEIRASLARHGRDITLVGFLPEGAPRPSRVYARYTDKGCQGVGIRFDLRELKPADIEAGIEEANADPDVHGIMVYYPVSWGAYDNHIKDLVDHRKDVEGLTTHWLTRLYDNQRRDDQGRKSILPCTPLAVVKLLDAAGVMGPEGRELTGRTVTIFNRSEVVGRPLAHMLANDKARVISFDVHGAKEVVSGSVRDSDITRAAALAESDVVITGVPSRDFPLVDAHELKDGAVCVNFSTLKNFTDAAEAHADVFIPRVGPMTVTMATRNTERLYRHFHA